MTIVLQRFDENFDDHVRASFGALQSDHGNLPLKQLKYHTRMVALAVRTSISQTYYNPFDQPIEATFIFPIEGQQAIVHCEMRIANRVVHARLKERQQARADYRRAIQAGHRAALLEENRPETFSMRVGNIPPGEAIQVCIETVGQLPIVHGEWTLRLPLVVAPRYTSGLPLPNGMSGPGVAMDTNQVPDASTVTPPTWLPGFASPVDLRLSVEVQMGQLVNSNDWISQLKSSLHSVAIDKEPDTRQVIQKDTSVRINVFPGERIDRDFILRGIVDDSGIQTSLSIENRQSLDSTSARAMTFAVNIVPPRFHSPVPRDVVFLLDRSGSMSGWKIAAARRGISRLVDSLLPEDRFQVVAFDDRCEVYQGKPKSRQNGSDLWHSATDSNRYEATRWLGKIDSRDGTEMGAAIEQGLGLFTHDQNQVGCRNRAIVLVTDGQVTGEDSLLRSLGAIPANGRPRLFCLGVDRAVNGSVLQRLSKLTGGTFELVESEKRLDEVLSHFADEIGSPVITNLKIASVSAIPIQLAPENADTLYSGRSLTVYGRSAATNSITLSLTGLLPSGEVWSQEVKSDSPREAVANPILLPLWAKARVRQLEDELVSRGDRDAKLIQEIVECSLQCNVLSRLTAFIAVDESERVTDGVEPHAILQPSEWPEGWMRNLPPIDRSQLIATPHNFKAATQNTSQSYLQARSLIVINQKAAAELLRRGVISSDQLSEAETFSKQKNTTVPDALLQLGYVDENDVAQSLAAAANVPFVDVRNLTIDNEVIELIPESVARENGVLPMAASVGNLVVLMSNPNDLELIDKLRFILNCNIVAMCGARSEILEAINRFYGQIEGESADSILTEFTDTAIDFTETASVTFAEDITPSSAEFEFAQQATLANEDLCYAEDPIFMDAIQPQVPARHRASSRQLEPNAAPIVRLVHLMITEAYQLRATHIILRTETDRFTVCYVIDGKLVERDSPPMRLLSAVITRLKILAKLDIAKNDEIQSGSIRITVGDKEIIATAHVIANEILVVMSTSLDTAEMPPPVQEWWNRHDQH